MASSCAAEESPKSEDLPPASNGGGPATAPTAPVEASAQAAAKEVGFLSPFFLLLSDDRPRRSHP